MNYKRILIVEVNWLGDVLFSTPLIKAIRKKYKHAHIACLVDPRCASILENNISVNEIIIYDEKGRHKSIFSKMRLIMELRKKKFDLAILLHRSFTKALIVYLAGAGERVGYPAKARKALLTTSVEPPEEELHKVEYFLRLAKALGCDISDKNYEFSVSEEARRSINAKLIGLGIKPEDIIVVLNPGGNWPPKRWPEEYFAKLGNMLTEKYPVKLVISGASKDKERAERISARANGKAVILAGETTIKELGALMERADFVISGDSGPMHMAIALNKKTIAIFGPTSPGITGPYGKGNYAVVEPPKKECEVPCYDLDCLDYRCMRSICPEVVLKAFHGLYADEKK